MATDPSLAIQKGLLDTLKADATLMGMVTGVYDFVPQDTALPYVTIGDDTLSDRGSHTDDGTDNTLNIHTWARGAGRKHCKQIMAEITRILHGFDLPVTGFKSLSFRREFQDSTLDPDGQTYHGIQRFRLLLGEV